MNAAQSEALALALAQVAAVDRYGPDHRLTAHDIPALHLLWLGPILLLGWRIRDVNIGKGGL